MEETSKSAEILFNHTIRDLHARPQSYNFVPLSLSEYGSDSATIIDGKMPAEFTLAMCGKFTVGRHVRTENIHNAVRGAQYGLDPSRLSEHVNEAVEEVRNFIGDGRDEIMDVMYDANIYGMFKTEKEPRLMMGVQTRFNPNTSRLRSIFVYHSRFGRTPLELRRRAAEHRADNDNAALHELHRVAEKDCPRTKRTLARAAAACLMPEIRLRVDPMIIGSLQN